MVAGKAQVGRLGETWQNNNHLSADMHASVERLPSIDVHDRNLRNGEP